MWDEGSQRTGLGALLPDAAWRELLELGVRRTIEPGTILMRQGDEGTMIYVLVAGRVKVSQLEAHGVETPIAIRHPGEVLGDIAVLHKCPRTATVSAVDPGVVHTITSERFERFFSVRELAGLILRHALDRMREAETYRTELIAFPLPQRVCRVLVRLATPNGTRCAVVDVAMSQEEIGMMAGAGRNSVGQVLAELRKRAVIRTERQRVIIDDLPALRRLAEEGMPGSKPE